MYFVYKLFYCMFKYTCLTIRPTGRILFNWGRLPIPAHQFLLFNKENLNCNFLEEVSVH